MGALTGIVRTRRSVLVRAAAVLAVLCSSQLLRSQTATEPALKAAFLFNFAKFAEFPADVAPTGSPLVLCVANDDAVAGALEETVKGHTIEGHALNTRRVKADGPLTGCHLLYAAGLDPKRAAALIDAVRGAPVLTVSDLVQFARLGGTANFIVEDGRMRFAINVDAARRARLQLSSKLLSLAKIVKDDANGNQH